MTTYMDFHRWSIEDRDGFWGEQAQLVDWHKPLLQRSRPSCRKAAERSRAGLHFHRDE